MYACIYKNGSNEKFFISMTCMHIMIIRFKPDSNHSGLKSSGEK